MEKKVELKKENVLFFISSGKLYKILCISTFIKWIKVVHSYLLIILYSQLWIVDCTLQEHKWLCSCHSGRGQVLFSLLQLFGLSLFPIEAGGVPISLTEVGDKISNTSQAFVFIFLEVSFYRKASTINVFFKSIITENLKQYIFNQTILLITKKNISFVCFTH